MTVAAPADIARIEVTEADLRAAWSRVHRDNWPATFEQAMQDPVLSRLVRMNALHPATLAPIADVAPPCAPALQAQRSPAPARRRIPSPPIGTSHYWWNERDDD